jgi:hypothetical protein
VVVLRKYRYSCILAVGKAGANGFDLRDRRNHMEAGVNARLRSAGLVFAAALAWFTFILGLIGPLTPSEGAPAPRALAVFTGIPELLSIVGALMARTTLARVAFVLQAAAIAALAAWAVY